MKKIGSIVLLFLALVIGVFFYNSKPLGGKFLLQATDGRSVTQKDLYSKPSIILFGYTYCPEICPTTFSQLSIWLDQLGRDADKLNVWFFTVDPERDTLLSLKEYLQNFSSKIIGITSSPDEQWRALKKFGIYWEKIYSNDQTNYSMNHTAGLFLLNKGGSLKSRIQYDEESSTAFPKIKDLVHANQ